MPDTTTPDRAAHGPLTESDVLALAAIINAAHDGSRVGRACEEGALAGEVQYGTARHIVTDDRGYFLTGRDDVRDGYLRVTGGIVEHFWPVTLLITEYQNRTFCTGVSPEA